MNRRILHTLLLTPALAFFASCDGPPPLCEDEPSDPECICNYAEPVADCGGNLELEFGATIALDGSGSQVACGRSAAYTWSFLRTPEGGATEDSDILPNATPEAVNTSFIARSPGVYILGLTVNDGTAVSSADVCAITILEEDEEPIEADAGPSRRGRIGELTCATGSCTQVGSDVTAPNWMWSFATVPGESELTTADIDGADEGEACFVPDANGTYTMQLLCDDGEIASEPDFTSIVVTSDDALPIADAGPFVSYPACQATDGIPLDGSGSYDAEADDLTFSWSLVSAPEGSTATDANFSSTTVASPVFNYDVRPGQYRFRLQVDDGDQVSAFDEVLVTLTDDNNPPEIDLGTDITREREADCRKVNKVDVCDACPDLTFELDNLIYSFENPLEATLDEDGDRLRFRWRQEPSNLETVGPVQFSSTTVPVVQVTVPGMEPPRQGQSTTRVYEIELEASDCEDTVDDSITITYTCKGT